MHEPVMKDDLLLFAPPPLFPDIFSDSTISDFPYVNPSMNAYTSNHSQNTLDVIQSLDRGEDKFFIENPLDLSSTFSVNVEGENSSFSSTPLFDSKDHEDVDELIEFSDHINRDLFTHIFDHDVDSIIVDLSKPSVYDYLSVDEVETLRVVGALQPKLMVMSGPHCPEVSFISEQEIVELTKPPHHSSICIEDQSNTNFTSST